MCANPGEVTDKIKAKKKVGVNKYHDMISDSEDEAEEEVKKEEP